MSDTNITRYWIAAYDTDGDSDYEIYEDQDTARARVREWANSDWVAAYIAEHVYVSVTLYAHDMPTDPWDTAPYTDGETADGEFWSWWNVMSDAEVAWKAV